jgi:signal transduction histidine kinase
MAVSVNGDGDSLKSSQYQQHARRIEFLWSPVRVVVLFVVVSLVWIVGTDWLLWRVVDDSELFGALQTAKGLVWIVTIAALLYVLLDRARSEQRLLHNEISVQQAHLERRVHERTENLIESREQLRLLTHRLDQMIEAERKQISRELHDQMGSDLTGLKIDLQTLQRLTGKDAAVADRLATALTLVDSMYQGLRRLSAKLRPGILDDYGLAAGIEWLADEFRKRSGSACETKLDDLDLPADDLRDTAVFRLCQESLTNVLKHAHAKNVYIALRESDGKLLLTVDDDGRGTSDSVAASQARLGVIGMRERAIAAGGSFWMEAREGGGTRVRAEIPLMATGERGAVA